MGELVALRHEPPEVLTDEEVEVIMRRAFAGRSKWNEDELLQVLRTVGRWKITAELFRLLMDGDLVITLNDDGEVAVKKR